MNLRLSQLQADRSHCILASQGQTQTSRDSPSPKRCWHQERATPATAPLETQMHPCRGGETLTPPHCGASRPQVCGSNLRQLALGSGLPVALHACPLCPQRHVPPCHFPGPAFPLPPSQYLPVMTNPRKHRLRGPIGDTSHLHTREPWGTGAWGKWRKHGRNNRVLTPTSQARTNQTNQHTHRRHLEQCPAQAQAQ